MISRRTPAKVRAAYTQGSLRTPSHGFLKSSPLQSCRFQNRRALSTASSHKTPGLLLANHPQASGDLAHSSRGNSKRCNSSVVDPPPPSQKEELYRLLDKIYTQHEELVQQLDELELEDLPQSATAEDLDLLKSIGSIVGYRSQEALDASVRAAWEQYGVYLPPDELHEDGLKLYRRLYGEPVFTKPGDQREDDQIFREGKDGEWIEVEMGRDHQRAEAQVPKSEHLVLEPEEDDGELAIQGADKSRQVAANRAAELFTETPTFDSEDPYVRSHFLADEGKFGTTPSSVTLPVSTMARPITQMNAAFPNKHISETAHRIFGGSELPDAISVQKGVPRNPIPFAASHKNMGQIESALFMSVLYPGIYASVLSALVEARKRLGTKWIRNLMCKEGGPSILDAGGAGAGVFAWREILASEWSLMYPNHPEGTLPMGKSTVLVGSDALRHRISSILENTTFLPRLPDYLRLKGESSLGPNKPGNRKNFDIIVAPHALLHFQEDYQRRDYVQNLWAMLNPEGGILILLEKGHKDGFAAIAGARAMILERLVTSPETADSVDANEEALEGLVEKSKGMIIAPCTTHSKCPMYIDAGREKRPREICRFAQRYVRPHVLQRILGNPSHNHEDAEFSYLAVQRGVDLRETKGVAQGEIATNAAFAGHENAVDMGETNQEATHSLSWPRLILPPIKRKGHVSMDVCTPEGKIERWTVPRSFSKQAYRDARKSAWGDLWALGAKTRIHRPARSRYADEAAPTKTKQIKPRTERRRKRGKLDEDEEEPVLDEEEETDKLAERVLDYQDRRIDPKSKKANKVPRWARQMKVKRDRKIGKQAGNV
ncbi:S-adenosylmethionine-dependent methyltransferase superfamily domain-containing protein [Arthroderma uncinatum]|uniref:S-adenosylmethionine-dependent methyltransferase superfamily domain-containing protein n=1 Tax=Arthroderma uncinatum TaxID=74035 RepID=UPI00144ACBCB|nr:S-adenosylmethionine-dependent methyltransferase superfamily domain-containing protein [Arthroderma uncinatum]KAF3490913.1 S-adenosylmethionine-dependent methyltransferase superfamily domain-containing protein [Arthroderma uncinatum]